MTAIVTEYDELARPDAFTQRGLGWVPWLAPVAEDDLTDLQRDALIEPARAAEFRAVKQESRRARLRQGALSWELQHDIADPRRYVERAVDESWTEHLRRFDRVTASDVALRDRKNAFHVGAAAPVVSRYVVEGD